MSILSAAVERAGLTEALTGGKALTVFAPSDAAFAAACEDLQLSKEEVLGLDNLADILTYHVVEGREGRFADRECIFGFLALLPKAARYPCPSLCVRGAQ